MSGICGCTMGPPAGGVCGACGAVGAPLPGVAPPRDPDYSPAFQDEYQRLWHVAAAERDRFRLALAALVDHIEMNGGCHRGCPEHDAARRALNG